MKSITKLSHLNISPKSRVLVITPHPDDEAVFMSGLIHKLTTAHIPTRALVMTHGEQSTLRYGLKPTANLRAVRTTEQHQSFRALGVGDYQILDFPDGQLESQAKPLTATLRSQIKNFRPTHLLTLEPDGIYGHPDHIALTRIVTSFASPTRNVLYATLPPRHLLPSAIHMAKKKSIQPIPPEFQLRLTLQNILAKLKALLAHRSQLHPFYHPSAYLFFFKNRLLTSEFYSPHH